MKHKGYNTISSSYGNSSAEKFGFNGKENNDELGLEWQDFGARNYEASLGRWMNVDPLAAKFPSYTPYSFVNNMPIWAMDPDGRDIIVLSYGKTPFKAGQHPWGHQALLLGNEEDGWTYYSLDGDSYGNSDVSNDDDYTIKHFDTLDEFTNSIHNEYRNNYDDPNSEPEREENGEIKQRYKQAFRITTSTETDAKMNKAARITTENGHNWCTNNCTHNVKDALEAGGLENGEYTEKEIENPRTYAKSKVKIPNFMPQAKQQEIERKNDGRRVDETLKRKKK